MAKTVNIRLRKLVDSGLKNHYIISDKTSINNGKNIYKKHVCNQQRINWLSSSKIKGA